MHAVIRDLRKELIPGSPLKESHIMRTAAVNEEVCEGSYTIVEMAFMMLPGINIDQS